MRRPVIAIEPATAAWLAWLPALATAIAAMLLLGAPLGAVLFPDPGLTFWPMEVNIPAPEPTEHAQYLLALLCPVLLVAFTVLLARRTPSGLSPDVAARGATIAQLLGVAVIVACLLAQQEHRFNNDSSAQVVYFTVPTLVVAAAIAGIAALASGSSKARRYAARWTVTSTPWRIAAGTIAVLATGIALLPGILTDESLSAAHPSVVYHLGFTYDETLAVLNGRSPLGDFAAQYSSLWPYALAAAMELLGSSVATYTLLLTLLGASALLALYAVLARISRHALVGLVLYLPLLATAAFALDQTDDRRFSLVNYFGTMPLRYAGPFLLAWIVARHIAGAQPHRVWLVGLAAGLVALNNADMGLPALAASVAALAWARPRPTGGPSWRRVALELAAGVAAALALVTALVLIRTGGLPDLSLLTRYARVFALGGFAQIPVQPIIGFSTVMYLTGVAAIGVATTRALRGADDRVLTGMLAWAGWFGLGAGGYYLGRSSPEVLMNLFPAWALALTLLTLVTFRHLARASSPRPTPAHLACLFGWGVLVCSLAQVPSPSQELDRLSVDAGTGFRVPPAQAFVDAGTRPGEPVLLLTSLGHRIALNLGLRDVDPYTGPQSIMTEEQLSEAVTALRSEQGTQVYLAQGEMLGDMRPALRAHGFAPAGADPALAVERWVAQP